jgi:hypothetical protein
MVRKFSNTTYRLGRWVKTVGWVEYGLGWGRLVRRGGGGFGMRREMRSAVGI